MVWRTLRTERFPNRHTQSEQEKPDEGYYRTAGEVADCGAEGRGESAARGAEGPGEGTESPGEGAKEEGTRGAESAPAVSICICILPVLHDAVHKTEIPVPIRQP